MPKLDKTLRVLDRLEYGDGEGSGLIDPRAMFVTVVLYLIVMLSVQVTHVDILLWFALFPIIMAPVLGLRYSTVFLQSLIVLPLVVLLGVFNPLIDKTPAFAIGDVNISNGWLSFIGIVIRGLLSMQVLLLLINSVGFIGMVRSMEKLGLPKFLTTQLLMVFRYIKVLIEEGFVMRNAIQSRSFGKKNLSIKMWGILVGQLFIRSVDRAERVHRAMLARGFDGTVPVFEREERNWRLTDSLFLLCWCIIFVLLRLFNLSLLFV